MVNFKDVFGIFILVLMMFVGSDLTISTVEAQECEYYWADLSGSGSRQCILSGQKDEVHAVDCHGCIDLILQDSSGVEVSIAGNKI